MNTKAIIAHIVQWLDDYAGKAGVNGFVVGVSGGIDSAVTSTLAARTGRPVLCLEMPIHQAESQVSRARQHLAELQANYTHVATECIDLSPVFDAFTAALPSVDDKASSLLPLANTRARLRMTTLYYFAGLHHYLVVGTGNKVEDFGVGFFTKYGDGGVDLSPIADLNKTEVYALGTELGIIEPIMQAKPTDGLWGDERNDEDQLGASYPELEWAMDYEGDGQTGLTERQREVLARYAELHRANRHKMEAIPVCRVPIALKS